MQPSRQELIADLVSDLRRVEHPGDVRRVLALWVLIAGLYSVLVTLVTGGFRLDALDALPASALLLAATLASAAAVVLLARAVLQSAIPDERRPLERFAIPIGALALWIAAYAAGSLLPLFPTSAPGAAREHCFWQTLLFSLPCFGLLVWSTRKLLPLSPRATAAAAGAASAALPAALMEFACGFTPSHVLLYHLTPIAVVAAIGAALGPSLLKRRSTVPRGRGVALH